MPRLQLRSRANRRTPRNGPQEATLEYRGHSDWRDMSEYAVHFTKDSAFLSASEVLDKILDEGQLVPGPDAFGAARRLHALGSSQRCVCFSEIPLDMLGRLVQRRSQYGLALRKDFLAGVGGAPVWYLQRDTPIQQIFFAMARATTPIDVDDAIWKLAPFVDYPGDYREGSYRFEWEREWRVPGTLTITPSDIAFLFVPASNHTALRDAIPELTCPLVDATWTDEHLQRAFAPAT